MAASSGKNDSTRVGKMSTKELARSLGLIRKLSASTKKSEALRLKKQPFTYVVVIDFESTCWKDKRMSNANEIIEFPAVLMHTSTGVIESEFHQYVQPSEHPRLSDFCKELTGITQSQVDDGIPIGTCLMLFNNWLQEICQKKNIKFLSHVLKATEMEKNPETQKVKWGTFVTWSDWDIGICLKNECQRKRHLVPQPLRSWMDLRETYKTFYRRKPKGLAGAMTDLGIQFTGRQHFGLDDARNTARLAWRMIKDGCVMNVTSSIDASVSVLHQIIQNGFKKNSPPTKPMKSILQLIGAQKVCETSHENQSSKDIQSDVCTSVHAGDDCMVENVKLQRNLETCDLKNISVCKEESKESFSVSRENQTRDSISHSVQNLLVPPVSVSDFTSTVDAVVNKPDGTKTLVSPITALTGLTCFAVKCSSETSQGSESAAHASSSNLLKRKLTNGVDSPNGAKRGLVRQTLGMRLPTKSSGLFRDGSFVKPLASPRVHCLASKQENAKSNDTEPKHFCKSSNLAGFKSQTPKLVDRTNLVSHHTFEVSSKEHASGSAGKSDVVKSSEKRQQDGTKIEENVEKENRIKRVEPRDGVFKTPMPVSSTRKQSARKGYSSSSTKATVTPTNFKSPVTPLSSRSVTPPLLRFNGGSVTPPLCDCGRRARRLTVTKPGPNQGRVFYACSVRNNRSSFGKSPVKSTKGKKNCNFFCWEPMGTQISPFQRTIQRSKVNGAQSVQLSFIDKP